MTGKRWIICSLAAVGLLVLSAAPVAPAQVRRNRPGATPGTVTLPYSAADNQGNQWMIYQAGWLQQQGNMPLYSQSAVLTVNGNGNQNNRANQMARLDDKTGEVIFDNLTFAGVTVQRRVWINAAEGYVRYVDIFKNPQAQEQTLNVQLQTNLNYGVSAAQNVNEPGGKGRGIGWAAATQAGRCAAELYAGRGAKVVPNLNWQAGNSFLQAQWQLTIPGNKEVAIVHVHGTAATMEAATQAMLGLKEFKLTENLPPEVRRLIVNFSNSAGFIGDREILRGDLLDVVELRGAGSGTGGDQLKGTVKEQTLKLTTFYGDVELAADKVIGLINVGQFRPRQLIVTADGEIFGGKLAKETIDLELSSGQTTQIPLSQISRIGWRKRAGESEDPQSLDKPFVILRSGDRMAIVAPTNPIPVITRYGQLSLRPESVAAIAFASEESGVHQIFLTDGSRFSGLVSGDHFEFKLAGGAGGQSVTFPASALARLQLTNKVDEPGDTTSTIDLANDDLLVGSLVGKMKLDTAFDSITLNAPEIKSLTRAKDAGLDVQLELWDQTRMSGQLQQQELTCALASGVQMKVPVALLEQYSQPLPQPSAAMIEKIKTLVGELGADDWKQREQAQSQLTTMGPAVITVLKQSRAAAGPEAQQRIDTIIRALEKTVKSASANPGGAQPADE
jgi:hypothetical protein